VKVCLVVLGGYVNGYGIICELKKKTNEDIILIDTQIVLGAKSNKIKDFKLINNDILSFKKVLFELKSSYDKLVLYPTNDLYLEYLYSLYNEIKDFCFIPLNINTYSNNIKKDVQYKFCEELNIPIPKSIILKKDEKLLSQIEKLKFPIIVKPTIRDDLKSEVFRNKTFNDIEEFRSNIPLLLKYLNENIEFLVSEFILGDDSTLYSHVGYRNSQGEIVGDWIGHKLSQYPKSFGVVSSGINDAPAIVREQSSLLLEKMDVLGLFQTEFKYDYRDKKYKLMEVNLRSHMWNKLGCATGYYPNYELYLDALGKEDTKSIPQKKEIRCFVYMKHELFNLIQRRKEYFNTFMKNILCRKKVFAIWDKNDPKPFIYDTIDIFRNIYKKIFVKLKGGV